MFWKIKDEDVQSVPVTFPRQTIYKTVRKGSNKINVRKNIGWCHPTANAYGCQHEKKAFWLILLDSPTKSVPSERKAGRRGSSNPGYSSSETLAYGGFHGATPSSHPCIDGFVWKCWVNIPNEIAIFHRDNDQQNHWVEGYTTFSDTLRWIFHGNHPANCEGEPPVSETISRHGKLRKWPTQKNHAASDVSVGFHLAA